MHLECLPWQDVLTRYDSKETLFYLDPPYHGHENDYGKGVFAREDYAAMAGKLANLKGKFLLSINDTPKMRAYFARFDRYQIKTHYTLGLHAVVGKKQVCELLYTNLAPEAMKTVKVASPYPQHRKDKEKNMCPFTPASPFHRRGSLNILRKKHAETNRPQNDQCKSMSPKV